MTFPVMTCKKCGEKFEKPDKYPGYADICPECKKPPEPEPDPIDQILRNAAGRIEDLANRIDAFADKVLAYKRWNWATREKLGAELVDLYRNPVEQATRQKCLHAALYRRGLYLTRVSESRWQRDANLSSRILDAPLDTWTRLIVTIDYLGPINKVLY